jgi:hypothetical protein
VRAVSTEPACAIRAAASSFPSLPRIDFPLGDVFKRAACEAADEMDETVESIERLRCITVGFMGEIGGETVPLTTEIGTAGVTAKPYDQLRS